MMDSGHITMDRIVARPVWRRRPAQIGAGLALAGIILTAVTLSLPPAGTMTLPAASTTSALVQRTPFQDYLALRAEVIPLDTYLVTAATGGVVATVVASDGEMVTAGQKLAVLSSPDFSLSVTTREAGVSVQLSQSNTLLIDLNRQKADREALVAQAEYDLHKAELELSKKEDLLGKGIVNEALVKPYRNDVAYQTARLASQRAAQAAEAPVFAEQKRQILATGDDLRRNLTELRQSLDTLIVKAPATGRLTGFNLKAGQSIKPGDGLGEVDSDGAYKLRAPVDEFFSTRLKQGLGAVATIGQSEYKLSVSKVFTQVVDGRITVDFKFEDAAPETLKTGETLDVKLSLGETHDATIVPYGGWLRDSGGASIFVVDASGGHADRRQIQVGRRNPVAVEVLGGLTAGERVITNSGQDVTQAQHLILK
jgi:HlyD family secretion protein